MAYRRIRTFTVRPRIPERLQALQTIAYNLWWSWNHEAIALFRRIDEDLFESLENNPVKLLSSVSPERFKELEQDEVSWPIWTVWPGPWTATCGDTPGMTKSSEDAARRRKPKRPARRRNAHRR